MVDIFRPDSAQDTLKLFMNWDGMGKLMLDRCVWSEVLLWVVPWIMDTFLFFSVLDADGKTVDQCRAWCLSTGTAYHRLSPLLQSDVELDEKDERVLVDLLWVTMAYMHARRDEMQELKGSLLLPSP